jgi:hypothetical protein
MNINHKGSARLLPPSAKTVGTAHPKLVNLTNRHPMNRHVTPRGR